LGARAEVRHLATKLLDGCACTVCWPAVLLKLKLVPVSNGIKNIEYRTQVIGNYQVCVPKIVIIDEVLTKLLQK